jgi:hypothetical protein
MAIGWVGKGKGPTTWTTWSGYRRGKGKNYKGNGKSYNYKGAGKGFGKNYEGTGYGYGKKGSTGKGKGKGKYYTGKGNGRGQGYYKGKGKGKGKFGKGHYNGPQPMEIGAIDAEESAWTTGEEDHLYFLARRGRALRR